MLKKYKKKLFFQKNGQILTELMVILGSKKVPKNGFFQKSGAFSPRKISEASFFVKMLKRHHHTLGQNSAFEKKCFFWYGNAFFDEKTVTFGEKS